MRLFATLLILILGFSELHAETADSSYTKDPYFQKLLKTNSQVPLFYNEQVRKQIGNYLKNLNNATSVLLGKTQYYYQMYGPTFDSAGVPRQLFLAAAAFSNCDPLYINEDGGSGMWVMSYATAKKYLLTTNSYIDERRDPRVGTQAATKYFSDLNLIYQDWLKTLVAFRTGPINMNMAIRRANNTMDYAKIHNFLSEEFQNAAVNYMAFWFVWNYHNEFKIAPVKYKLPDTDTVQVQREIGLNAIAYNLNLSEEILKLCNSELRLDIVPVSYNNKGVRLPKDKIVEYRSKLNVLFPPQITAIDTTIRDSLIMDDNGLIPRRIQVRDTVIAENEDDEESSKPKKDDHSTITITYVVKHGDGLLLLADLFDCKVSDIKKWNGIKKDALYKGQKLKIKVPKKKAAQYKKINTMSMAQKKKLARRS